MDPSSLPWESATQINKREPTTTTSSSSNYYDESSNNMFRKIFKRLKGTNSGEAGNQCKHSVDLAAAAVANVNATNKPEALNPEDDDDSSSHDSDSSSECYYPFDERIVIPTRRNNGKPAAFSPPTATTPDIPALVETPFHRFDLELLARTHFPDFGVPDGELTESSDDESVIRLKEECYRTKEDQDVAVFLDLAKRMSLKSLLHLLQGHVRMQNLPQEYLHQYNTVLSQNEDPQADRAKQQPSLPRKKQFRWAEISNGKVRVVVNEIESIKEHKSLWWTPEEMHFIRSELIDVVKFFRKRRLNYITSVETIARHQVPKPEIEEHLKKLMEDSFARGLESHIVKMMSEHRKSTIQAVIEEQDECRRCSDNAETTAHCLREQSVAYSLMSTRFAACMGKCDEIDSLKATMSRWRAEPATASGGGFFDV